MEIEAVIHVNIVHVHGTVVDDSTHVLNWTCADGTSFNGIFGGFEFEVCPSHANPDECDCDYSSRAIYRAIIHSAGFDN